MPSTGQERLWFLQRFNPDDSAYHITWPVRLRGPIDEAGLAAAFTAIAARHETLRTRFVLNGDLPAQTVDDPREVRLDHLEPGRAEESGSDAVGAAIVDYAGRPFDLGRPAR